MKVIVDASQVYHRNEHGYKYFQAMLPRLSRHPELELEIVPSPTGLVGEPAPATAMAKRILPPGKLRTWLGTRKREVEGFLSTFRRAELGHSLFHSLYYTLPPAPGIPLLTTMLDLIAEKFAGDAGFPRDAAFLLRKEKCVRQARHFIAISECTKQDLCAWYGIAPKKVDVVPLAIDAAFFSRPHSAGEERTLRQANGLAGPYVLQVGGRLHHKNFPRLLEAYAQSPLRRDMTLVAAGEPFDETEHRLVASHGVTGSVINVVRPDEETLRLLYRCAAIFVYPSLYEGFGLPPLEAMASGVPVAAARAGSIPEISGDGARYFDPTSPAAIAAALEALADPGEAAEQRARGLVRAKRFTWDETADRTYHVYLKLLTHTLLDESRLTP